MLLKRVGSFLCSTMEGVLSGCSLARSASTALLAGAGVVVMSLVSEGLDRRAFVRRAVLQEQQRQRCAGRGECEGCVHS